MINSLHVSNFKSFPDGVPVVPFAPITLVYGPNSAGKSTLLQSLALLKQSLEPRVITTASRPPDLLFTGDYVDLGGFLSAVHGHDREKRIGLGMSFIDPSPEGGSRLLADEPIFTGLEFGWDDREGRAVQRLATLGDKDDRVSFSRNVDGQFTFATDDEDPAAFVRLIRSRQEIYRKAGTSEDKREADNIGLLANEVERILQGGTEHLQFLSAGMFPGLPRPDFIADNRRLDINLGLWFEEYLYARARAVTEVLSNLAYLGPLRSLPARFQLVADGAAATVGFTGENTTRLLASNPKLLKDVNTWLDNFKIRYRLDVLPLAALLSTQNGVTTTPEIGNLVTTALVHNDSGVVATPRDVGFGVSQMLPVIVQLLVNSNATICIEQPEVHIHPRLQADIGDLINESVTGARRNQVIVETHSEALMLRIQRHIAEKTLSPGDVCVLYVDAGERGRAVPKRLELDEFGYFTSAWPDGFFTERGDDVFARSQLATPAAPQVVASGGGDDDVDAW